MYGYVILGGLAVTFFWLWMRRREMCRVLEEQIRVMGRLQAK